MLLYGRGFKRPKWLTIGSDRARGHTLVAKNPNKGSGLNVPGTEAYLHLQNNNLESQYDTFRGH